MNQLTETDKYYKARSIAEKMLKLANDIKEINQELVNNDLNLENYPQNWESFDEFPEMLQNIFVSDFKANSVQISANDIIAQNIE